MALKFNVDIAKIAADFKDFSLEVQQDLQKAVGNLAAMTHAKVKEYAQQELHSSRQDFLDSVGFEEVAPGVWVVSVSEDGMWVEEGIPPNKDMKEGLLKNAKTSKTTGNRYKVIPFHYGKAPSTQNLSTQTLVMHLKNELNQENARRMKANKNLPEDKKLEKIPFKKIERNADGSPKVGKLHEFNFKNPNVMVGGTGRENTPRLQGLAIYQKALGGGNARRDILTFRTVSSGAASAGKWIHPGFEAKKFLDRALDWAINEWETRILPEVTKKWE
jgi:hypothetical protein